MPSYRFEDGSACEKVRAYLCGCFEPLFSFSCIQCMCVRTTWPSIARTAA